jgi:hypothetical protein
VIDDMDERWRSWRFAALAVAAAVGAVIFAFSVLSHDESGHVEEPGDRPEYFVTAEDQRIALRSSEDGWVIKVLA